MSADLIKRLRDALKEFDFESELIAEADAHLSSAGQSREDRIATLEAHIQEAADRWSEQVRKYSGIQGVQFFEARRDWHLAVLQPKEPTK